MVTHYHDSKHSKSCIPLFTIAFNGFLACTCSHYLSTYFLNINTIISGTKEFFWHCVIRLIFLAPSAVPTIRVYLLVCILCNIESILFCAKKLCGELLGLNPLQYRKSGMEDFDCLFAIMIMSDHFLFPLMFNQS